MMSKKKEAETWSRAILSFPDSRDLEILTSLFLEIVETINRASTLGELFESVMELAPVSIASYHHFPTVGAFDYKTLGTFHGYNLPPEIEAYYKIYKTSVPDPGLLAIFSKAGYIWASDLALDPIVVKAEHAAFVERAIEFLGDGLCIPLYGPNNRRGYMFVTGDLINKEAGDFLACQVQALASLFHVRFCLMIQNIQRQINLTERQAEVLELLTYGNTNSEIAEILEISTSTVSGYVKDIFIKLDVSDRVSASMRAQSIKVVF